MKSLVSKLAQCANVYLPPGKYSLLIAEDKRTALSSFANEWEAHMKPRRLHASSEHTRSLEWVSLASLLRGGRLVRTVGRREVPASAFIRDCTPALTQWFGSQFGFITRPSLRNMSLVEDKEQRKELLDQLRKVFGESRGAMESSLSPIQD